MLLLDQIAETRITEAMAQGEFDNLPGQGQPVSLDDDSLIPENLRVPYRILKNAGYCPPELEKRREIKNIEQLLATTEDAAQHHQAHKRLTCLLATLEAARKRPHNLLAEQHYHRKLVQRLG